MSLNAPPLLLLKNHPLCQLTFQGLTKADRLVDVGLITVADVLALSPSDLRDKNAAVKDVDLKMLHKRLTDPSFKPPKRKRKAPTAED